MIVSFNQPMHVLIKEKLLFVVRAMRWTNPKSFFFNVKGVEGGVLHFHELMSK